MKKVTIVVPDCEVHLTSISSCYEMMRWANQQWVNSGKRPVFEIRLAGFTPELKLDFGQISIQPLPDKPGTKNDLLIVPSLFNNYHSVLTSNKELINWMREQYKNGAEIATMCTGAFLLAATGLLDGKSVSTHWFAADDMKKMFPNVNVHNDTITRSGRGLYTNGGGYSFLNLMLFLIEKYFDRETTIACSKMFQIDIDRTSQSPFAIFKTKKDHGDDLVSQAQNFLEENLQAKISFEDLASKLAVSRRNFDRRFLKATGNRPGEYLQRIKVEAAKSELENGRKTISEVMYDVGYSDDKAFREVFKKLIGISPLAYRARYNKTVSFK